jgi:hypothetical protein
MLATLPGLESWGVLALDDPLDLTELGLEGGMPAPGTRRELLGLLCDPSVNVVTVLVCEA